MTSLRADPIFYYSAAGLMRIFAVETSHCGVSVLR